MPGSIGGPTRDKSPDQDVNDRSRGAEINVGRRPYRGKEAKDVRSFQLRIHGQDLLGLRKENTKNRRENADFVDAPMWRELRPRIPDPIENVDAVAEIEGRVQQIRGNTV